MRLVSVLCILLAIGFATNALADKAKIDDPNWHWQFDGTRATYPEAEPNDTCPGQAMSCGDIISPAYLAPGDFDWYRFYATAGDPLTIGTDAYNGSSTDTYLELYFECGGTIIAQDDDSGPLFFSLISNFSAPSTGYYDVKVRGYSSSSSGDYILFVNCTPPGQGACCFVDGRCVVDTQQNCGTNGGTYQGDNTVCDPNPCPQPPPPPENDTCAGATPIEPCSAGTITGDLTWAIADYSPTNNCTGYSANGKDVVYMLTVNAGDQVHVVYTTPSYDGSIYIVSDCADMSSCVIGEDDPEPETFTWTVATGGIYYLIADAYATGGGGPFTLDYSITCIIPEACCFDDGTCQMLLADNCRAQGGHPQGAGTSCDNIECEVVPIQNTTWGQIKLQYR